MILGICTISYIPGNKIYLIPRSILFFEKVVDTHCINNMNQLSYSGMNILVYIYVGDIDQINGQSCLKKVVDTHCVRDETMVRSPNQFRRQREDKVTKARKKKKTNEIINKLITSSTSQNGQLTGRAVSRKWLTHTVYEMRRWLGVPVKKTKGRQGNQRQKEKKRPTK